MKQSMNKKIKGAVTVSAILLLWSEREVWIANMSIGGHVLQLMFTICMVIVLTITIIYLFIQEEDGLSNKFLRNNYLKMFALQVVAFLPMYTQNFMYGDDLWKFAVDFEGTVTGGLALNRPFIHFLLGPLLDTSFESIRYFRFYNGIIFFLFGCVFMRFMLDKLSDGQEAFVVSTIIVIGCVAVDCIGYACLYPVGFSLLISAISYIVYVKAKGVEGYKKFIWMFISGVCLITAFCMYQICTPIVFLMHVITEKYNNEKKELQRFKDALYYLCFYGVSTGVYMMFTKILQMITGMNPAQGARGEVISSLDQIIQKVNWFFFEVCPETISRVIAIFVGNCLFKQNNIFYGCSYKEIVLGIFLTLLFLVVICVSIGVTAYHKKSYMYLLISVCAIPLSFWPFLVLPESYNLTYYAMGIILLFLWYIWDGMKIILVFATQKMNNQKKAEYRHKFFTILLAIVALQSNQYAENAWVNYCRDSYEYLANAISAELETGRFIDSIVVQGNIGPYAGGRPYVIFCVENILNELGHDAEDYNITQRSNEYYILSFEDAEVNDMELALGKEKMNNVLQYYTHNDMYNKWDFSGDSHDEMAMNFLQDCFVTTGQLVLTGDSVISINLDGFNQRNLF